MKAAYENYLHSADSTEYEQSFGWPLASAPTFEVILGDIFALDWIDADFIFCNSTCFDSNMMQKLHDMACKCKKGTWFITLSNKLPHAQKVN